MEIEITTEDATEVDAEEIATAVIRAGYYVAAVWVNGVLGWEDSGR